MLPLMLHELQRERRLLEEMRMFAGEGKEGY
jgi:hypothetical protein